MKTNILYTILIFCVFLLPGCGRNHVGMGGRVMFSDNDEPLTRGTVAFATATNIARGEIDENGYYTIGLYKEADGLPPGSYRIYLTGTENTENGDGSMVVIPLIASKYSSPDTSGLTLEVDKTINRFDFKVDRATESKRKKGSTTKSVGTNGGN